MWYIYTILRIHRKKKILPFAAIWMELEILILSEVRSERKKQIPYGITYL